MMKKLGLCVVAACMAFLATNAMAEEVTTEAQEPSVEQTSRAYAFKPSWGIGLQYGMTFTEMDSWNSYLMDQNGHHFKTRFSGEHDLYIEVTPVEGFRISAFGGWTSVYKWDPGYDYFYGGIEPAWSVRRSFYELAAGLGVGYGQYRLSTAQSEKKGHGLLLRPFIEGRVYPCDFMAIYLRLGITVMKSFGIDNIATDPAWNGSAGIETLYDIDKTRLYHMGPHIALGLRFGSYPTPVVDDSDNDGIGDDVDSCPTVPGEAAYQGCPNPDSDGDGVCDPWVSESNLSEAFAGLCFGKDQCPESVEDQDGFEDEDGCADPDNDNDGFCDPWVSENGLNDKYANVCKTTDMCPYEAEDRDQFEDEDGCPEPDNDGDGVCDPWVSEKGLGDLYTDICKGSDICVMIPGPGVETGCPNPDQDDDGYCENWVYEYSLERNFPHCKGIDQCPNEKGEDAKGCKYRRVVVTADQIQINEAINFDLNKSTIKKESDGLLEDIAQTFKNNPQIKKVEIQGHTDLSGKAKKNQKLSEDRAKSVNDRLVKLGVEQERLTYKGYGMTQPVEPLAKGQKKETPEQAAKNRRVVFQILEQDTVQNTVLKEK